MNWRFQTAATIAALLPWIIAHAAPPRECVVIPLPSTVELSKFSSGPYASALAMYPARPKQAAAGLAKAWSRVQKELATVFDPETCDPAKIRNVLARYVLAKPPMAAPLTDRFSPPAPVVLIAARASCEAGSPLKAVRWLQDMALGGDVEATASMAVLLAASGRTEEALALLPVRASVLVLRAARAYVLVKSGRREEAMETLASIERAGPAAGSQAEQVLLLLKSEVEPKRGM